MKPPLLFLVFVVTLAACTTLPAPDSVAQKPIESYLDPALTEVDRSAFLQALRLLHPAARESLSFVDSASGRVYASSAKARNTSILYRQVDGSVYQTSAGASAVFPLDTPAPSFTSLEPQSTFDALKVCKNDDSGAFRRVLRKPSKINWMTAKVRLPTAAKPSNPNAEAGGFKQRVEIFTNPAKTLKSTVTLNNGPFIYAGGWGADGTRQLAADAGFQLSTGGVTTLNGEKVYAPSTGLWRLFIRADGVSLVGATDNEQVSDVPAELGFEGGQEVDLTFLNLNNFLLVTATGIVKDGTIQTRSLAMRLPINSGWNANGAGNLYKFMVTSGGR